MSTPSFEAALSELRRAAPPAPDRVRAQVRAITTPRERTQLTFRWRRAVAIGATAIVAIGLSTAALNGLKSALNSSPRTASMERARTEGLYPSRGASDQGSVRGANSQMGSFRDAAKLAALPPSRRLQRFDVSMSLRVRDLSRATQAAVRETRRLGGYVAAADYQTGNNVGDSTLKLRVPTGRRQQAIARFNDLGTLLSQHIAVADLKAPLDQTDKRIKALQKVIAELEAKSSLTPSEQITLDRAKRTVKRLAQTEASLIRQGSFARISLQLTTRKAATQHVEPGRFDQFWDDAGDILGKEAIAVLYALVIAGPFLILAALALLAERARRRRADQRLLGETG